MPTVKAQWPQFSWLRMDIYTASQQKHKDEHMTCYTIQQYILETSIRFHRTIKVNVFYAPIRVFIL